MNKSYSIPQEVEVAAINRMETMPVYPVPVYASLSLMASNVGKMDLGCGNPICDQAGFASRVAITDNDPIAVGTGSIMSGRHGTFYLELRHKGITAERQEANFRAVLAVHAALKTRSAESITVEEVAQMLQKEYDAMK